MAGESTRRRFIETGLKGALLLPYVAPVIETIVLSDARAQSPSPPDPPPPDPPPQVYSCNPDTGNAGDNIVVTVTGADFQSGATVDFGYRVQTMSVTFISSTSLQVQIDIKSNAPAGFRDIIVTNPDAQSDTLINGFTVSPGPAPPPTVTSCAPDSGDKGTTTVVSVYGSDFVATPTADFGSRINILGVSFVSSTQLDVTIQILSNAVEGPRDFIITNPDAQSDTLIDGFTVGTPLASPPTVSSCSPNNGNKGATIAVTVYGSDFVATPTADFGKKVTVQSVSFVNSTQLSVNISIASNAKSGSRDVTITNPDAQSDTLSGGFTVN